MGKDALSFRWDMNVTRFLLYKMMMDKRFTTESLHGLESLKGLNKVNYDTDDNYSIEYFRPLCVHDDDYVFHYVCSYVSFQKYSANGRIECHLGSSYTCVVNGANDTLNRGMNMLYERRILEKVEDLNWPLAGDA